MQAGHSIVGIGPMILEDTVAETAAKAIPIDTRGAVAGQLFLKIAFGCEPTENAHGPMSAIGGNANDGLPRHP